MHILNKKCDYVMTLKPVSKDGGPTLPTTVRTAVFTALLLVLSACREPGADRIRVVYRLGRTPTEPNKGRIAAMLHDPDREVRTAVLVVMTSVDPDRARTLALEAFDDPEGMVRAAAIRALAADVFSD